MATDNFSAPHTPPQHEDHDRPRIELECIGSFAAHTPEGEVHTIEIWTRFGARHDRARPRVAPGLIVLTTTDGHDVEHIAKGHYRLHDHPEVSMSSGDANAP